ncbi:RNA deprotection pyrophosphohydrolase [Alkalibacillus sp. S2W]|uniref:RNA deprotection pyrophosphohydrolase n=1 Tax=Alkalibacillus sp. S2W TaxID=3386553 RepID=UPI00398C8FE2
MEVFKDYYNNTVKFVKGQMPFSNSAKHVWVIARYQNKWLLTQHRDRGIEFPGGKVEPGETAEDAAKREVYEETGGVISTLTFIGQYYVDGKGGDIVKNVYFADVHSLDERKHYFETEGPVLLDELPKNVKKNKQYSFMMKDQVLKISLEEVNKRFLS